MMRRYLQTLGLALALLLICTSGIATYAQDTPKPNTAADQPVDSEAVDNEPDIVFDKNGNLLPKHFDERTQKSIEAGLDLR